MPIRQHTAPQVGASLAQKQQVLHSVAMMLQGNALATSSKEKVTATQRRFTNYLHEYSVTIGPGGISNDQLRYYIAFLFSSASINSMDTIHSYISMGVRTWHLDNGFPWVPLDERPTVKSVMAGARRLLAGSTGSRKKLPITLQMLDAIRLQIDFSNPMEVCWWTAALLAFFCLLRKANVAAPLRQNADAAAALRKGASSKYVPAAPTREDIRIDALTGKLCLRLRNTKTIQNQERVLNIPIANIASHSLCPSAALKMYLRNTAERPVQETLFGWYTQNGSWHVMNHDDFVKLFKRKLAATGIDPSAYAGHSFRRGGATFAFAQAGLQDLHIKALGDWVSSVFMRYCEVQEELRVKGAEAMAAATRRIIPQFPHGQPTCN